MDVSCNLARRSAAEALTAARLRELLSYDPETGEFTWRPRPGRGNRYIGQRAGATTLKNYRIIRVDRQIYFAHRLAWLYVHGEWPPALLDHINADPADNRIANLRSATYSDNSCNQRIPKGNRSGVKGVHWFRQYGRWRATITRHGRQHFLGYFDKIEDAAEAYRSAAANLHGEFARVA